MGDSDRLNVGDWVLAIGSPFGFEQTVTAGIISAKGRVTGRPQDVFQEFLQTDAAINPGNSGGPLVNLAGEVVGISTQIVTQSGAYNGIGFAVPSSTVVEIYNALITTGRVRRGFLGIVPDPLTPQYARQYGVKDGQGVLVKEVTSDDSPASRAGLRTGDVITSINGQKVKEVRQLIHLVASLPVGSSASVTYIRDGNQRTTSVRLEERPYRERDELGEMPLDPHHPREVPEKGDTNPKAVNGLGISGRTLTTEMARSRGLQGVRGLLVTSVEPGSVAEESDVPVRRNDVIVELNPRSRS
jgi:serine protease Do